MICGRFYLAKNRAFGYIKEVLGEREGLQPVAKSSLKPPPKTLIILPFRKLVNACSTRLSRHLYFIFTSTLETII
jgi:hypothetical protein